MTIAQRKTSMKTVMAQTIIRIVNEVMMRILMIAWKMKNGRNVLNVFEGFRMKNQRKSKKRKLKGIPSPMNYLKVLEMYYTYIRDLSWKGSVLVFATHSLSP
ncbi:hypothetical protein ACS0PU_006077 [Formica fusca]